MSHYSKYEASHKKYQDSAKGKIARKRYQESEKGIAARVRYHARKNLENEMMKDVLSGVIESMTLEEIKAFARTQIV